MVTIRKSSLDRTVRRVSALCLALTLHHPVMARILEVTEEPAGRIGGVPISVWTYPSDGLKVNGLLFLPRARDPLPLILFNHDGVSGISEEHMRASARLARAGYAVFAPSYRGEDGSEGTVEVAAGEVRDVLNVLPLLARVPGIDARKLAVVGVSHGALISVLAAAREPEVDAVVTADGVMDIYGWWQHLGQTGKLSRDPLTRRVYGHGPDDKPQAFSTRHALDRIPNLKAPVLILQSGRDDIVPVEQAITFKAHLDRARHPAALKIYPDCRHAFLVYAPYQKHGVTPVERIESEQAWQDLLGFLRKYLKP
jgi:dipeptidyl aminopeptidase/acylaminoacyl peptidase